MKDKKYHLIAYKSSVEEWSMGHLIESQYSDCQIYLNKSVEDLIEKWSELEVEGGYVFQLIEGGKPLNESKYSYNPDHDIPENCDALFQDLSSKVKTIAEEIKENARQKAIKKAEEDVQKKADALKRSELALLETLKQKYQ